ncbi:MAG: SDR family NAD(P)-dependent oxidoreductase [Alphaproteobacteria bacterium]|nr:SDR family NAD(P)-dependent oxidoreductase [Alphaproteobacteria bacterium]
MKGKTVIITGATSGIGEVAAVRLAEQGARIVFVARDKARADDTMAKLRKANAGADHAVHMADLSTLAEMKRIGAALAREPQIDVLVNNAGALFNKRQETADGLEMTFALNHMAYFVITNLLLDRLQPGARIVTVASNAHRGAGLDFDDLQSRKGYVGFPVYSKSKLANILFNRELARRSPAGVTANALQPEEGARTIIYLASSPEVAGVTGEYFYECKPTTPTAEARNDDDARRLWEISEQIAGPL